MRPITKYTRQIVNANNIPSVVREAFRLCTEERPGAVHIELPEDVAAEEAESKVYTHSIIKRPTANDKSILKAAEIIEKAK